MSSRPPDDLDRVIDETLASMVEGEPRRVSAASVRQAMGEGRGSRLPIWLAAAAALIVGLGLVGLVRTERVSVERAPMVAPSTPSRLPTETPNASSSTGVAVATALAARPSVPKPGVLVLAATSDEGLPLLAIAGIDVPEPLSTNRLTADPIRIPGLEIVPLTVSTLSTEQEHNQEPTR